MTQKDPLVVMTGGFFFVLPQRLSISNMLVRHDAHHDKPGTYFETISERPGTVLIIPVVSITQANFCCRAEL